MNADNVLGQTFWAGHWSLYIWHTLFGIFLALLIFAIALGNRVATLLLANKTVMYLGIISYSIYLWHFPFIHIMFLGLPDRVAINATFLAMAAVGVLAFAVAMSVVSYLLLEGPFNALRRLRRREVQYMQAAQDGPMLTEPELEEGVLLTTPLGKPGQGAGAEENGSSSSEPSQPASTEA